MNIHINSSQRNKIQKAVILPPIRKEKKMALNPQLFPNGMPVPFTNEMFVLVRDGVEFEVDKIPGYPFLF